MKQIIITITTLKSVSTVQLRWNDLYVAESSKWTFEKERFPFLTLCKALYKIIKLKIKQIIKNWRYNNENIISKRAR